MPIHEYKWRNAINLFRPSRVVIDNERQVVLFERCLRTTGFWNLFPLHSVSWHFDELSNLRTYSQFNYRCVSLNAPGAVGVFLDAEVPQFDEFVAQLRAIVCDANAATDQTGPTGSQTA